MLKIRMVCQCGEQLDADIVVAVARGWQAGGLYYALDPHDCGNPRFTLIGVVREEAEDGHDEAAGKAAWSGR